MLHFRNGHHETKRTMFMHTIKFYTYVWQVQLAISTLILPHNSLTHSVSNTTRELIYIIIVFRTLDTAYLTCEAHRLLF